VIPLGFLFIYKISFFIDQVCFAYVYPIVLLKAVS